MPTVVRHAYIHIAFKLLMKFKILISFPLISLAACSQAPCEKCDLEVVKMTDHNIQSLNIEMINAFICAFDTACAKNAEYSEWSNEVLFKIANQYPDYLLTAIKANRPSIPFLLHQFQNPVNDTISLQTIYDKLKATPAQMKFKEQFLAAIVQAARKTGRQIVQ